MTLQTRIKDAGRVYKMYAGRLEKLDLHTFEDMLFHIPFRYEDFTLISPIATVQPGETVTLKGTIRDIKNSYLRSYKTLQKAKIADETGEIDVTWFNQPFLTKSLHVGDTVAISGKADLFARKLTMQSPDYELLSGDESEMIHTGRLVPVYPETKGVSSKWLRRQVYALLKEHLTEIPDYLPPEIRETNDLMPLQEAIKQIHFPDAFEKSLQARERLSFDELYLLQLRAVQKRKEWQEKNKGNVLDISKYREQVNTFIAALPFELTDSQKQAIEDIFADFQKDTPMNRLLQGDVGSGKTIVAAVAMYLTYLNGYQSLIMAPTEILAEQHYKTISQFLTPFGVKIALITGSKKPEKGITYDMLIGTHAILSENVVFEKLGLTVIDEQQRFGVAQRSLLRQKGTSPHLLTMTATPIPRTAALTLYGELDVSYLNHMPHGRKLIKTWLVPTEKRDPGYEWIRKEIQEHKSQAFIICPFIEESENMTTVKAATKEYDRLAKDVYPDLRLGMLHGRMKAKEKDEVLTRFRQGKFDILVATPVVEVGIDIPNATIIVIEAAERFGLAQLHQLRGRVGRGEKQSYCLLFTDTPTATTVERLKAMETMHIGSQLAELDLKLRGPGEIFGTLQHGSRKLKYASYMDIPLIEKAKQEAMRTFENIEKYPELAQKIAIEENLTVSPD